MKSYVFALAAVLFFFTDSHTVTAASLQSASLQPESLEARAEMAASKKTLTIFIEESNPEKATELLNNTNDAYAKRGWTVFSIHPFMKNGDFEGFFITYEKNLLTH